MESITRVLGRVVDFVAIIGATAIFLMMAHITLDVFLRYVFWNPLPGTLVFVSNYYMVAVSFLSLAFAERRSAHIAVEVATEHFPLRFQRFTNCIGSALSALIFAMLAWRGFDEAFSKQAIDAFMLEQGVRIPIWPSYYLLPVGAGLMSLTLLFKIIRYLVVGSEKPVTEQF